MERHLQTRFFPQLNRSAILPSAILLAIPIVAAFGGKGMVVVIVFSGLAALLDLAGRRRMIDLFRPLWLLAPLGGALLWMIVGGLLGQADSANWLLIPKFVAIGILGLAVNACMSHRAHLYSRHLQNMLLIGVTLGIASILLFVVVLGLTGTQLWGSNIYNPLASILPGVGIIAALMWPCAIILWSRGWRRRLAAPGVTALIIVITGGSASFSLLGGGLAFLVAVTLGRRGVIAIAALVMVGVLAMPVIWSQILPAETVISAFPDLSGSAQHRLYIWQFTSERIAERPLAGWGLDSSRSIPGGDAPAPVGFSLLPLHPHNAALQVWLELGFPGALLLSALLGLILVKSARRSDAQPVAAAKIAMTVTIIGIAMLSFGIWQSWWLATLWLLPTVSTLIGDTENKITPSS